MHWYQQDGAMRSSKLLRITLAMTLVALAACTAVGETPAGTDVPATGTHTTPTLSTVATTTIVTTTTLPPVPEVPAAPKPDPLPPPPGQVPPAGVGGVAVIAAGGADLWDDRSGSPFVTAHEGLVMAVEDREGDWFLLRTMCDTRAWAEAPQLEFTSAVEPVSVGQGTSFSEAVVVLDPGHGGANHGAQGPTGLREEVVNLDIARRARDLLEESHTVDWESGIVYPGSDIRPVGRVWLTRTEGPPNADYEAGLLFRATLAGSAGANALIAIHNNAAPDGPFEGPGSEIFYMFKDPDSRRLGGLLIEEMRRSFTPFDVAWMGDLDAGAKYRLQEDGETDYYGILRRGLVPSVISEGAFISNEPEEALLATPEFRQAYAEAVYRALVRFVTTDDPGSGFTTPYLRTNDVGSGNARSTCQVPAQP